MIIRFETGCRKCSGLIPIGKGTYMCGKRAHLDDSSIIPIKDGKKTEDWNLCNGEYYSYKRCE